MDSQGGLLSSRGGGGGADTLAPVLHHNIDMVTILSMAILGVSHIPNTNLENPILKCVLNFTV